MIEPELRVPSSSSSWPAATASATVHRRRSRPVVRLAAAAGSLLLAAACGAGTGEPEVAFTVPGKPATTTVPPTTLPKVCSPAEVTNPPADQKPAAAKGEGEPPASLVTKDDTVGTGAEAKTGDTVKMQYVGVLFSDGSEFDSSWSRGAEPFEFTIGQGMVIKGWDQGIPGMKVGGRRTLTIPAALGYGETGSPPKIPANAALIFVVDLVQVCSPQAAAPGSSVPIAGDTVPGSLPAGTGSVPTTVPSAPPTTPTTTAAATPGGSGTTVGSAPA